MSYEKDDRLALKGKWTRLGAKALVLDVWPDFATAKEADPKLGELEKSFPDGFDKDQRFYSVLFQDGVTMLIGEAHIDDVAKGKAGA